MAPRGRRSQATAAASKAIEAVKSDSRRSSTRTRRLNASLAEDLVQIETTESLEKRIFEGVVIPPMATNPKSKTKAKKTSSTTSPVSPDSLDTTRDNSDEYDTPATSVAATPPVFASSKRTTVQKAIAGPSSGKRKRTSAVMVQEDEEESVVDTSADADFARALQEQEYGQEVVTQSGRSGWVNASNFADDSEDDDDFVAGPSSRKRRFAPASDDDDLSSAVSMASEEDMGPPKKVRKTAIKPIKAKAAFTTPRGGSRSTRKASSSARKAIANLGDDISDFTVADSDEEDFTIDSAESILDDPAEDSEDDIPLSRRRADRVIILEEDDEEDLETAGRRAAPSTTLEQRRAQRDAAERRRRRYAHIGDPSARRKARNRDQLEKSHPEIKHMWEDLEAIPVIKPVQEKQPETITRKLKSFQLEGLDWMKKQEQSQYKGGLLGDEMGMGKTIQAVSLIMSDYPAKDPTLVMVPPVALMQWSNEIREYTNGKLKVLVYHGQNSKIKGMKVKDLREYDVIMISYNSLESVYRKETKGWSRGEDIIKEKSAIHSIHYHRLILDEAHSIKSRTTGVAKACFALKGNYKWCLSGTPVQNRIGEFFSLLRFLEVRPFADYYCKKCECAELHWQLNDDYRCKRCNHGGVEHVSVFNQELLNPITGDSAKERKEAMRKLGLLTSRIMLRRMKRDHTSSMELPPKEVIVHNEFFGEIERDFSKSIMSNTTRTFDTYVSRGVMLNNYANIFGLIMQMRQVANHPDLLLRKHAEGGQNVLVCNICDEPAEEAIRSRCHHEFCRSCVRQYVQTCEASGGDADCPRCHIALSIDWEQPDIEQDEEMVKKTSIINRIKMENWTSSSKIEMLVYDLYKLRSKKQTTKSIVFSQFTSMLQLVEWRLRRAGFNTVMLDGSMTPIQRQRSIEHFMNNPDVEVFLVSLKAGGVALNLVEASQVFIVDPWWNPAAEWQSADRCHRIGQRRPCTITRLCIEDSVESRIVALQEKKAALINSTINNDGGALDRLAPEDLQFLFRGT